MRKMICAALVVALLFAASLRGGEREAWLWGGALAAVLRRRGVLSATSGYEQGLSCPRRQGGFRRGRWLRVASASSPREHA